MKFNVVFCGTPDICIPSLKLLNDHCEINLKYIISMPDRAKGRGLHLQSPEVAQFANENKIDLFQTKNINKEQHFLEELKKINIDFFIVFAFAQFLSQEILHLPRIACFNIHASLLSKYRGASPIQHAILNGDELTGISIQRMVKQMDAGDLVSQDKIKIEIDDTAKTLYNKIKKESAISLSNLINKITNNSLSYSQQDKNNISFAPSLNKNHGHLKFKTSSFQSLYNQVRAFDLWPGTFCFLNEKRLKVFKIEAYKDITLLPGETSTKEGFLLVGSKDQTLRLKSIQLEGKKPCLDINLINGFREKIKLH